MPCYMNRYGSGGRQSEAELTPIPGTSGEGEVGGGGPARVALRGGLGDYPLSSIPGWPRFSARSGFVGRMNLALVERLRCPTCGAPEPTAHCFERSDDGRCEAGVLVCERCSAWYPISGWALDLLPEGLARQRTRAQFFDAHRARLEELTLTCPRTDDRDPDPGFAAQAQQRDHFDDLARRKGRFSYEALGRLPFQRALRDLTFEEWRPLVPAGSLVLDIGCGNGLSSFDIAELDVEVLAFDISGEQIAQAAERAHRSGVGNVSFFVGDADAIPVATGAVDCILCYGSLHHVPSPERTLADAARVLKDGGRYFGVENHITPLRPLFDALMRLRPLWHEEAGARPQIGVEELEQWTSGTGLRLDSRPIVFVPPHVCNWIGVRAARWIMRWSNGFFGAIPLLRNWGGLISITGRK